jgi:lysophospholipase L1-like esterase
VNHPVEVNRWGELPALQKDKMTVYSLIPDKKTHLRYNNYDYYVNTNSFGFNGPEIFSGSKDSSELRVFITGDAFTMPEGMEYEKAYPWLLQIALSERFPDKKVLVFNGGVTGYGPNEMYASLLKYIDTLNPDIVINQIFINEFEEINLTEEQRLASIGLRDFSLRERLFSGNQIPQQLKTGFHKLMKDESFRRYRYNKSLIQFYDLNSNYYQDDNISLLGNYFTRARDLC